MVWGPVPNNGKWFSCSYRSIRAPEKWSGEMVPEDDLFILENDSFISGKMINLFLENDSFNVENESFISGKMIHLLWKMIHLCLENGLGSGSE